MSPSLQASVAPSGRSIILRALDGAGVETNITALSPLNEVQTIALLDIPATQAFSLAFGGQTTASLAVRAVPPANYGLWTFPTVPGHTYEVANVFDYIGSFAASEYYFEILDGQKVIATFDYVVPADGPATFTDPGVNAKYGPIAWTTVISGVVAPGSSLQIRISAPSDPHAMAFDSIRVKDDTAGTIAYYCNSTAANFTAVAAAGSIESDYPLGGGLDPTLTLIKPSTGKGEYYVVTGGAPAIQAALESLTSVGTGGVAVVDVSPDQGNGVYQVTFTGQLGSSAQPLLISHDANVSVAEVTPGGMAPTLSIGGGPPVPIFDWIWQGSSPRWPILFHPLPQSAPASQIGTIGTMPYDRTSSYDGIIYDDSFLSASYVFSSTAGKETRFDFPGLSPATYRFSITYPVTPIQYYNDKYLHSSSTQFVVRDDNGNVLATFTADQTQTPSDSQLYGHGWQVVGSLTTTNFGGLTLAMTTIGLPTTTPPSAAILDAVMLERTSPDTSVTISAASPATLTVPDGWITTEAGPIPAASFQLGAPSPTIPPFVAAPKSMKMGYNVVAANTFSNLVTHSNLAYLMGAWRMADVNGYPTRIAVTRDSSGNPQLPATARNFIIGGNAREDLGDPAQGTSLAGPGLFTMTWDGDPTTQIIAGSFTTVTEVPSVPPLGFTSHYRVYDIQFDPKLIARPMLFLEVQSTTPDPADATGNSYIVNLSNLQVYPPDPADPTGRTIWANPPKFHPWFLEKVKGVQSLRFLEPLRTVENPYSVLSQCKTVTHANRFDATSTPRLPVSQIQAPTGNPFFVPDGHIVVQVTTAVPHGLFDGCVVQFSGCGTAQFASGTKMVIDTNASGFIGLVHVIDDHTVIAWSFASDSTAMTNVLTGGTITADIGTAWPFEDIIDLVTKVGCDLWLNTPLTLDVSPGGAASQLATMFASALPRGQKLRVEFSNECWNYYFYTYDWSMLMSKVMAGANASDYHNFYTTQAKAVHDAFQSAFEAAGRPGDFIRVLGAQAGNTYNSAGLLAIAKAGNVPIDELAVAVYFQNNPALANIPDDQLRLFDQTTSDQLLDFFEIVSVYGQYPEALVGNQIPVLQANGYTNTKMVAYEGSPEQLVPINPAKVSSPAYMLRQNAVKRHPRIFGILLQMAQTFQDAGLTLWNWFYLGCDSTQSAWDAYESSHAQRGTGNPATDTINVTNPQAKDQILSESGGAVSYWASLANPSIRPTRLYPPTRNGRVRTIGLPRGMSRLGR
jgi:hypothetical protein